MSEKRCEYTLIQCSFEKEMFCAKKRNRGRKLYKPNDKSLQYTWWKFSDFCTHSPASPLRKIFFMWKFER